MTMRHMAHTNFNRSRKPNDRAEIGRDDVCVSESVAAAPSDRLDAHPGGFRP